MESGSRVSLGRAKSCLRRPIALLSISFVVVVVVVIVAEYFIVHAIDENMTSDTTTTTMKSAAATTKTAATTKATTRAAPAAATTTTTTTTSTTAATVDLLKFPDDFILASATASYQVEGAWNVSDKGENIWDYFCHNYPSRCNYQTGDDACKSYYLYKRDVQMLVETGFKAYRFSIDWARVLPNGTSDYVSTDGVAYYNNLINELLAYNITPLVTMYHWDLPQVLQADYNGWLNSSIAELFADYAEVLFQNFGDRVKYWTTINEPNLIIRGYTSTSYAPGYNGTTGTTDYIVNHNIVRAHGKAFQRYNNTYRATQHGVVGITFSIAGVFALNESSWEDREAALRSWEFTTGIHANPIFSPGGNYPSIVRERVDNFSYYEGLTESRLPHFTDEELDEIRGSADFFGVNHYSSNYVTDGSNGDAGVLNSGGTSSGEGLRNVLNWVKNMYDGVPTIITENGCQSNQGLNDTDRITLYHSMLKGVLEAIYEDGCNVFGYTAWSLMDNMEWSSGYSPKYGLWQVDFDDVNRTRTMKQSAYWFQELLSTWRLPNTTDY